MPDSASDLSSQIGELKQLYEKGLLSEANFRAALVGLGVSGDQIQRYVERQIIVQGDYFDKRAAPLPPSPTLDAGTALTRYLHHVIQSNRRLQLQGVRSGSGLVSIELEQIYITLTAAEKRTSDGQWWFDEMDDLIRGETSRASRRRYGPLDETGQQVTMKVQEALREHARLVVLGDPGCGKTTLLKYLALTFARDLQGETGLVETRLHLKDHRLPVLLPLRDFASYLQKNYPDVSTDGPSLLLDYLQVYFAHQDIALPERFFADRLQRAECALLFDGVDEVADLPMRYRVARLIERFTIAYPDNRYVVTSRIVGYTGAARLGENYLVKTVCDFTWDDITQFVTYWNHAVEVALAMGKTRGVAQRARAHTEALLQALQKNARVRELAVNPLMLTVIALVQRYRAQLPERRVELYDEAIEVLLSYWDVAKGLSDTTTIARHELDTNDRRSLLESVALWMMEQHAREIEADELHRQLGQRFSETMGDGRQAGKVAEAFLQLIRERSGLLTERGQGVYAFNHLTFQEYLAARAISAGPDYIGYTLKRVGDSWWREVVLLEAGYLSTQGKQRTTALIQAIMNCHEEPTPYHNLILAAECLHDVGQAGVQFHLTGDLYGEVRRRLRQEFKKPLRAPGAESQSVEPADIRERIRRRAAAAEALVNMESSGPITWPAFWRLPYGEPVWVDVPAGEFSMGGKAQNVHHPVQRVLLKAFKIARVPITNAQYRFFIEATQYRPPDHWEGNKIPPGYESHPVVGVSWYDAQQYCAWLSHVTGKSITLPSEAQWEKAARGDRDQRAFPWGDDWDVNKCNTRELGLEGTTPVGIFPDGASLYGCLDMAGNVWEWTSTLDREYPYRADDGRENPEGYDGTRRVLRGGAHCAERTHSQQDSRFKGHGFRVVVSARETSP